MAEMTQEKYDELRALVETGRHLIVYEGRSAATVADLDLIRAAAQIGPATAGVFEVTHYAGGGNDAVVAGATTLLKTSDVSHPFDPGYIQSVSPTLGDSATQLGVATGPAGATAVPADNGEALAAYAESTQASMKENPSTVTPNELTADQQGREDAVLDTVVARATETGDNRPDFRVATPLGQLEEGFKNENAESQPGQNEDRLGENPAETLKTDGGGTSTPLEAMSVPDLRALARERGMTGISQMNKTELLGLLSDENKEVTSPDATETTMVGTPTV